ncbi:histidine phosphatase family protein [Arachnia propionica]|uniref:Histidine phosphatase family protein n=2 Tax=Arachnia propionica TaxID=1750 RepID=A0A3P1T7L4_9ACTN|nr:histidine phosphatase family protein [Arachnia propionica]
MDGGAGWLTFVNRRRAGRGVTSRVPTATRHAEVEKSIFRHVETGGPTGTLGRAYHHSMRLILIRHGETQSNVDHLLDTAFPGAPLTDRGHAQAASLPDRLAKEPIEAVFASVLTRAQQTAAPLGEALGLEVEVIDGVQEISAGVEEMSPDWSTYVAELASWSPTNVDSRLEGGESAREFMTRFTTAVTEVEARGHACAAIVSHGAALRVWGLAQQPEFGIENAPPLENTAWIVLNGSMADGWTIEDWGQQTR